MEFLSIQWRAIAFTVVAFVDAALAAVGGGGVVFPLLLLWLMLSVVGLLMLSVVGLVL